MKNFLVIDASGAGSCNLIGSVDDGTNKLVIEIELGNSTNAKLEIDGAFINIDKKYFTYEIPVEKIVGEGYLNIRVVTDAHSTEYFKVEKVSALDANLFLKQISDHIYQLYLCIKNETGVPIATHESLGVVKPGYTMTIGRDGLLETVDGESLDVMTNEEIEELLK